MIRTLSIQQLTPLRRLVRGDVYFWAKALLLAIIAIEIARVAALVIAPAGPLGDWRPAPPKLLSPEAQLALLASVDPFSRGGPAAPSQPGAAPDLKLFGTRASAGAIPGSAIVGASENEQKAYLVGEEVSPGLVLSAVYFDHVELKRGNTPIMLYMEGADPASAAPAGDTGAQPSALSSAVANAFEFKPRMQGDKVTGIVVAPGSNAALFNAAGLRSGDVVVAVNGAKITSLIDVQQLQSSIAPGARLVLMVERGGQAVPVALNIPGN